MEKKKYEQTGKSRVFEFNEEIGKSIKKDQQS